MAIALLPSVRLLPQSLSKRPPPTSSPLSVRRPRPRALPLPRVHCRAGRTPDPLTAAREAAAFWAGKLAGAVPWKAAVSGVVALAVSFTCRKLARSLLRHLDLQCFDFRGTFLYEGGGRALVPNGCRECYLCREHDVASSPIYILSFYLPMPPSLGI